MPTATARPGRPSAKLADVSLGGARVLVAEFPKALFQKLLGGKAYAKITVRLEERGGKEARDVNLAGRIVWMDYDSQRGELRVGLEFDASDSKTAVSVRSILEAAGAV